VKKPEDKKNWLAYLSVVGALGALVGMWLGIEGRCQKTQNAKKADSTAAVAESLARQAARESVRGRVMQVFAKLPAADLEVCSYLTASGDVRADEWRSVGSFSSLSVPRVAASPKSDAFRNALVEAHHALATGNYLDNHISYVWAVWLQNQNEAAIEAESMVYGDGEPAIPVNLPLQKNDAILIPVGFKRSDGEVDSALPSRIYLSFPYAGGKEVVPLDIRKPKPGDAGSEFNGKSGKKVVLCYPPDN
jgi:hypothetical protein